MTLTLTPAQVAFGRVTRSSKAALEALAGPAKLKLGDAGSRLVTVCNGDVAAAQVFGGKLNADELNKLLQQFAGGKKCRSRALSCCLQAGALLPAVIGAALLARGHASLQRSAESNGCGAALCGGKRGACHMACPWRAQCSLRVLQLRCSWA